MDTLKKAFVNGGVSEKEAELFCSLFVKRHYKKNEYLLRPGSIATKIFFVETGSVILGIMTDKKPVTRHLAIAPEFITSMESFHKQMITDEFLMATVNTDVYELTKADFDNAYQEFPVVQLFYQKIAFELLFKCQQRLTNLTSMDATTYYEQIKATNPGLLQSMNQADLASYMGIEPQSLSRLRSKKSKAE